MKEVSEYLQELRDIFQECVVYDNAFMFWDLYDENDDRDIIRICPVTQNEAGDFVTHPLLAWCLCGHTVLFELVVELKRRMNQDSTIKGFIIYEGRELKFTTHPRMLESYISS